MSVQRNGTGRSAEFAEKNGNTPAAATDIVNKAYADSLVAGGTGSTKASAQAATVAALPTCTYANGTAGVGATLTKSVPFAALPAQDGVSLAVGDRLLVKDESDQKTNGIYVVTSLGSGAAAWVLTRATDADTGSRLPTGTVIFVVSGTFNAALSYEMTTTGVIAIGTSNLVWTITGRALLNGGNAGGATIGTLDATDINIIMANVLRGILQRYGSGNFRIGNGTVSPTYLEDVQCANDATLQARRLYNSITAAINNAIIDVFDAKQNGGSRFTYAQIVQKVLSIVSPRASWILSLAKAGVLTDMLTIDGGGDATFGLPIDMGSHLIKNVTDPVSAQDADTLAARNAAITSAIAQSGGVVPSSESYAWYANFFGRQNKLPANIYKEEFYTFPTPDWTDIGSGSGSVIESMYRFVSTGNRDNRIGWDLPAGKDKILFLVGGIRFGRPTFFDYIGVNTGSSALTSVVMASIEGAGQGPRIQSTPGGNIALQDYTLDSADLHRWPISAGIYYDNIAHTLDFYLKPAVGQWFRVLQLTGLGSLQMTGVFLRFVPGGTGDYEDFVCPVVIRYA